MLYENYLLYILGTIDTYPAKVVKHLQKLFIDEGIAQKGTQLTFDSLDEGTIDISEMACIDAVKNTIENKEKAVTIFEKWEYNKDYKYSVLFQCGNFNDAYNRLIELVKNQKEYKKSKRI